MIDDINARLSAADVMASVADQVAKEATQLDAQEPSTTSNIAQAIRREISHRQPPQYNIEVTVLDIPDRGPNSLEKKSGADLYLNVTVTHLNGTRDRKAILIQAKRSDRSAKDFPEQCKKMLDRTDHAYGWVYDEEGVRVVNAQDIANHPTAKIADLDSRSCRDLFDAILACKEGDRKIALPADRSTIDGLRQIKRRLAVPRSVDIQFERRRSGTPALTPKVSIIRRRF